MKIAGFNPFRRSRRRPEGPAPITGTTYRSPLPAGCDSAVLGGGITGLVAAIELARRGQSVVLLEKGRLGGEQTSRALGWVASMGDQALRLPLSLRSKMLWRGYQMDHGVDTSYRACGLILLCNSAEEMDGLHRWREIARTLGEVDARPLTLAETRQHMPAMNMPGLVGAWHQPSDGKVSPERLAPALARIATGLGVCIVENCGALGLDIRAGAVSGVETEIGRLGAGAVLVAGGAWSRPFLRQHGVQIAQLPLYSSLYRTHPIASTLGPIGATASFGWTRDDEGRLTFGNNSGIATVTPDSLRLMRAFLPALRADQGALSIDVDADFMRALRDDLAPSPARLVRDRVLGALPDAANGLRVLKALQRELPDFAGARIESAWAGVIDATPDKAPIIGQMGPEGLFVCTGFSAHGLAMAPAAAELVADLMVGKAPVLAVAAYSNDRFTGPHR